ncbi:MAG: uracil-DNA glycosylase family protein [Xanthomonadaceae bacterium]|nr:uracil-DNA glycosylase family protein [Xanthomonadaceae bacterium]
MKLNIENHLRQRLRDQPRLAGQDLRLPKIVLDPSKVKAVMINEVVPPDPNDDFYGNRSVSAYMESAIRLFRNAGIPITEIGDILKMGIYLTNAVKTPKTGYDIERQIIQQHASILEWELDLFPNLAVIALMGDVAKKSFNGIAKKKTGKNAIPAGSTYKLRAEEFHCGRIRILPSYIMTGKNLLIEKSKSTMVSDDIRRMKRLITGD